jgi:hypothetical protein
MPEPLDCPGIESWQALFGGALSPQERERCERHLESCGACQARLDRFPESGDPVVELARRVGDVTVVPTDSTLVQVLERLCEGKSSERSASGAPAELYFLQPSDRPDLLGLLGPYEVCEVIGQGGMGIVLKAFEPALHRLVAIKVLAPALAGSPTARRRFTREAQAAAAVCHDHIVAVHGVHEANGLPHLVMQYIPGESLQAKLDRAGPLEVLEVVRIGLQTALGLAAAHAQGLIHRDVKPANLLLENGLARVKITDFGLARMVDDVQLTRDGVVAGTPEYMSPEQARGETIDHRTDLFSLGSVLHAMCTGLPPFRGSTAVAVLRRVSDETPRPIRMLNPDMPEWLERLVRRLMAKDPTERFSSAAEVAALLENYLAHLRQPTLVPAPELPPSPTESFLEPAEPESLAKCAGGRWRWGLLVALLTASGMGVAWWLAGRGALPGVVPLEPESKPISKDWLVMVQITGLVGILALLSLGAWLYLRRRRPARGPEADESSPQPTPSSVLVFSCPSCGKTIRARSNLAGKKGKCRSCGNSVLVPPVSEAALPDGNRPAGRLAVLSAVAGLGLLLVVAILASWNSSPPPPAAPPGSYLDQTLGAEPVAGIEEEGFHNTEKSDQFKDFFRWTNGAARLVVPLNGPPPKALYVRLGMTVPKSLRVAIRANGRALFDEHFTLPQEWSRTFDLAGVEMGKSLVVEILSDSVVPADEGKGSGDTRHLGLCVRGIILLSGTQDYLNVPLAVRTLPEVPETGFYHTEYFREQPCRWTNGAARLTVPLHGKPPKFLDLTLEIAMPRHRVQVIVNGQQIFDQEVERSYPWSVRLPLDGVPLGDSAQIELNSTKFVPAKVSPGLTDTRTLGVRVRRLVLAGAGTNTDPVSYTQEVFQDLRNDQELGSGFFLADKDETGYARREPEGLRVSIPAKRRKPAAVAIQSDLHVVGDFEITGTYELLSADRPIQDQAVAGALLWIWGEGKQCARLGRFNTQKLGAVYEVHHTNPGPQAILRSPTKESSGQLRFVRRDSQLSYQVSDPGTPGGFRELFQTEFGTDDLTIIRLAVNAEDPTAAVEARLIDLQVRSRGQPPSLAVPAKEQVVSKRWLVAVEVGGLIVALALLGLGAGAFLRRRSL